MDDLIDFFEDSGNIEDIILKPKEEKFGFAFLQFQSVKQAERAIR